MIKDHTSLKAGALLVAPPMLWDPNFRRAVVLLCEHTEAGSFGLILNFRDKDPTQWEIFYSQQQTEAEFIGATANDPDVDVDLHVLQLGGTSHWDGEFARPYLAFTLGGTHIRTSSAGSNSDTFFSGSIGFGMKFLQTSRIGIRAEARAYGTLLDSNTDLFCSTGPDTNVCAIRVKGKMLNQVETFAGITVRF